MGRLVAALVLVLALMRLARDPRHWEWLWAQGPRTTRDEASSTTPTNDGTRRARGDVDQAESDMVEPDAAPDEPTRGGFLPDWGVVRDDRPFQRAERDLLGALLIAGRGAAWGDLTPGQSEVTSYAQLIRQPESLRGKLLAIRGTARRARRLSLESLQAAEPPAEDPAPGSYFEVWLTLADGPPEPVVVYLPSLPAGFPVADAIAAEVDCEAVYFKRWPYEAGDGLRLAPVLVAATLGWTAPPPTPAGAVPGPAGLGWPVWLTAGAGLLLAAAAATRRRLRRNVPRRAGRHGGPSGAGPRAVVARSSAVPPPSAEELAIGLARLAAEAEEPQAHAPPTGPETQP